jgi:uncharacterized delta-60 repeat protein
MPTPFTLFSGTDQTVLTSALLAPNSGVSINTASLMLSASGSDAVNFYDGSLTALGIGAGLLLTTGTTPGTTNTLDWFGQDNSASSAVLYNGDAEIDAVVNSVFQTQSYDATTLSFDFTVTDPAATSVSFDLVFGSDEYPEWVDQFVDCGIVMVNGVNYALFNHDPMHPLSVVSSNLAAGYFQDNAADPVTGVSLLPIEYDGVSHVLKIVAPITAGGATNHIKIGIADTGDHIYDSGMFLANFSAGTIPGSGVVITKPGDCTDGNDVVTGSAKEEYFDLKDGNDTLYAGAGDDIVVAGQGNDVVYGGSGNDKIMGGGGDDILDGGDGIADTSVYAGMSSGYSVEFSAAEKSFMITDSVAGLASDGKDTLKNVEYVKFSDGLFELGSGGLTLVSDTGITPPPSNTPGIVVVSGVGSAGHTLTATVSDPDGISATISYQWQFSTDNGGSWSDISGAVDSNYLLLDEDVGHLISVVANYTDNGAQPEMPVSLSKTILAAKEGDLLITLIHLDAPASTSIINPLTTLLKDAVDLGISPNLAAQEIKQVLGIPADVQLQSYDAYAVLQVTPNDPVALAVEKVAVQVAILTSLSDDDTGMNLTLAILDAAATNTIYDLGSLHDICSILGIDPLGSLPDSASIILDRNSSIANALKDGGDVTDIEREWVDFCGTQDNVASTSIADLSIHLNQAPVGSAAQVLPDAVQNQDYLIASGDLLQGFTDPDGDVLAIAALSADANGSVQDNQDGTWSFTPSAGYVGPVELTYTVQDGYGGSIAASQLLIVAATQNHAPTFGVGTGKVTTDFCGYPYEDNGTDVAMQSDGKIILAGQSAGHFALARYNVDGTLDITFGGALGLVTTIFGSYDAGNSVALQSDGKIILAGASWGGSQDFALVRYNTDGTLDTTFSGDGIVTSDFGANGGGVNSIVLQVDGKILVAGSSYDGNPKIALARYNTDGTLDTTFSDDGVIVVEGFPGSADCVILQADGKILVSGSNIGTGGGGVLIRYNTNGTLDTTFGDPEPLHPMIHTGMVISAFMGIGSTITTTVLSDGKILMAGSSSGDFALARYNTDGSLDTSFGDGDGNVTTDFGDNIDVTGKSVVVQSDGKIIVAGYGGNDFALARYNSDGTLDTTFSDDGKTTTDFNSSFDYADSIALQSDGKIIVAGYGGNDFALARYNVDGTLDCRFGILYNTLNGIPLYNQYGTPVVLDSDVQVFDADLVAAGNYAGATLTLLRHGGANPEDIFSMITPMTQGSDLVFSGASIGTVTTNSGGILELAFNANATQTLVNALLQQIAYSNSSASPSDSVQIDWIFSDGNTGSQGIGGALSVTGSTIVQIIPDTLAPTVTSFNPADAATDVAVGSDIKLVFSEPIQRGTGVIAIHADSAAGAIVESFDAATSPDLIFSDTLLTINPTSNLSNSTHYVVTFAEGSVEDLAGNHFAGSDTYDFTTAPASLFSLTGSVHFWKSGAAIAGVTTSMGSDGSISATDGLYQHLDMADGSYALTSAKVSGTAESTAIKANDALAALKIAVGMNPNADGSAVSPYQYLAADVNHDGQVKAADALNILKMAVKLDTAPAKEWLFVPESVGSESMTRTHVVWPDNPIPVTLDVDQELNLIGIVKGDVNGSWVA